MLQYKDTPPGFTGVLLLDASHFSAHCYSETGLLAIDIFTCGEHDTEVILQDFQKNLRALAGEMKITAFSILKRF